MASVLKKLQLRDQDEILVLNAPDSFEPELAGLAGVKVGRDAREVGNVDFALVFVTRKDQIDTLAPIVARKAPGDALVWFAYPKGSSKKYKSEINRDNGWQALGGEGFEPVRQVAIDEDWSALRFRRVEFIKTLTRRQDMALSEEGKDRTTG